MSLPHSTKVDAFKKNTNINVDSESAKHGQFHARPPHDKPLSSPKHQPGSKHSPLDSVDTFHAQAIPPGTAPKKDTYEPQNIEYRPRGAGDDVTQSWNESMPGASSKDVHTGLGHPGQGQTSSEMRHDGQHKRKTQGLGLEGKYGSEQRGDKGSGINQVDTQLDPQQRGLDRE